MNDFTRNELCSLVSNILNVRLFTQIDNYDEDLLEKIEVMLDNYCEHQETYEDFNSQPMRCKTCQEVVGE